ncbi:MAG TPA: SGNH/GDSL hydrolase family protein [Chroococcales cyanobacterium]
MPISQKLTRAVCLVLSTFVMQGAAGGALAEAAPAVHVAKGDRVVFFGDSITSQGGGSPLGFINLIRDVLKDRSVSLVNAGIGGNTSSDLLARIDSDVIVQKPSLVVLYIGINDVWRHQNGKGLTREQYEQNLTSLIDKLKANQIAVLLCTPSIIGEQKKNPLDDLLDQFAATAKTVAEREQVPVCDLHSAFRAYLAEHNPEDVQHGILTGDGVHMNKAGNVLIASEILKSVGEKELPAEASDETGKPTN